MLTTILNILYIYNLNNFYQPLRPLKFPRRLTTYNFVNMNNVANIYNMDNF